MTNPDLPAPSQITPDEYDLLTPSERWELIEERMDDERMEP